jgi:hypothetical protein
MIPKNTPIIVQRVPGQRTRPILSQPTVETKPTDAAIAANAQLTASTVPSSSSSTTLTSNASANAAASAAGSASGVAAASAASSALVFSSATGVGDSAGGATAIGGRNEQERLESMFADAATLQYQPQPGERPSFGGGFAGRGRGRGGGGGGGGGGSFRSSGDGSGIPPPTYTCHRCGQTGHYISQCPTNSDPGFATKKVKSAIGIPKSALEIVPLEEGATVPEGAHVMMIDGKLAIYKPNEDAFRSALADAGADEVDPHVAPDFLKCFICKKVLVDCVKLPCCDERFCDTCIRASLLKKQRCVACNTKGMTPDLIEPDRERRRLVADLRNGKPILPPAQPKRAPQPHVKPVDTVAAATAIKSDDREPVPSSVAKEEPKPPVVKPEEIAAKPEEIPKPSEQDRRDRDRDRGDERDRKREREPERRERDDRPPHHRGERRDDRPRDHHRQFAPPPPPPQQHHFAHPQQAMRGPPPPPWAVGGPPIMQQHHGPPPPLQHHAQYPQHPQHPPLHAPPPTFAPLSHTGGPHGIPPRPRSYGVLLQQTGLPPSSGGNPY